MAKEYNIGDRLYLPVWVTEKETNVMMGPDKSTTITDAKFSYAYWHGKTGEGRVRYGEPGLLLTTEEVAEEYKDKATVRIQLLEKENEMHRKTICNRDKEIEGLEAKRDDLEAKLTLANEIISDKDKDIHDLSEVCDDWKGATEELKSRNAELEALLKEVMATRDEAIKQNDELIAENKKLKADCNEWKDTANERLNAVQTLSEERNKVMAGVDELKNTLVDRTKDVQHLTEENDKLKAELDQRNKDFDAMKKDRDNLLADNKRTTAYYMEANRTATEAAEANDDLKAKIADLRNRVGEQLAQIQDLNAEIHFLKAERDKFAKTAKDKADLANKACDERNDEHGDLVTAKAAIDYLQEENKKLKQELKDAEASYNVVAETSIKRKNRITTMEEVIVALVEKIRRLESDD